MNYQVQNRLTGEVVYAYEADAPDHVSAYPFETYNHIPQAPRVDPVDPAWRIHVGAFFDRFGAEKLSILSSSDALVQAAIKDASVRKFIDLQGRRAELTQVIGLLNSKSFAVDVAAVLDVAPTESELWNG